MRLRRLFPARRPPGGTYGPLSDGERVLGWATTDDGATVVATSCGVWWPGDDGLRRLPWHEIQKATWSGDTLVLLLGEEVEPGVVRDGTRWSVRLAEPANVPEVVRARVTRSVVHSSHHPLPGGGGVRVVARRVSGEDGLTWLVRFDTETDRADPAARAAAAAALERVCGGSGPDVV